MSPGDYPVDDSLDAGHTYYPRRPARLGGTNGRTVVRPKTPYSILSPTQSLVRQTIIRFGQASSSQVRDLHYQGTERGRAVRASRHLKALSERGFIKRIPYRLSGFGKGSGEYIYCPPESTARTPNLHTLDITELYVRLKLVVPDVEFDPEPWAHTTYGGYKVTPDGYVKLPGAHYWIEIDRASESPSVISAKMNRYLTAYRSLDGGVFPQIVWLAHDVDRVRTLEREAKRKGEPGLFACLLFDEATEVMTRELL